MSGAPFITVLTIFWFLVYWLFGGVFFATVALLRVMRLKKARFSCLYTLASLGAAYGAARTGIELGKSSIEVCLNQADDAFDQLAAVLGCGVLEITLAAAAWLALLLALGFVFLILSRGERNGFVKK